jgi:hypothetical protein
MHTCVKEKPMASSSLPEPKLRKYIFQLSGTVEFTVLSDAGEDDAYEKAVAAWNESMTGGILLVDISGGGVNGFFTQDSGLRLFDHEDAE